MATSGSNAFTLDLVSLIEEAWERATGDELRSGYELRTARRSLNLLFLEWQNRGLHWWTLVSNTTTLAAGAASFALDDTTIDVLDMVLRKDAGATAQNDRMLTRMSINSYDRITNKLSTGEPTRYYVSRKDTGQLVYVWPVPTVETTLVYWAISPVQDAAEGGQTQNVPVRYLPALVAGLAFYIAQKVPEAAPRLSFLKQFYEEQFAYAEEQEREKASWRIVPSGRR